jgi:deazaflavin-dependent oxidoreductase (nitroreductase family)
MPVDGERRAAGDETGVGADASAMAGPPAAAKQLNKVAVRFAGHRFLPLWAVLRHRGRKSGKEYAVPIAVMPTDETFVIALPWGRGTDWVRNVRAAGRCTIRWKGADYECTEPTFVDKDVALAAARGTTRRVLQRRDFPHGFLQLNRRRAA